MGRASKMKRRDKSCVKLIQFVVMHIEKSAISLFNNQKPFSKRNSKRKEYNLVWRIITHF